MIDGRTESATLNDKLERLRDILRGCGSVCIGYSGGVDSVFLATVAVDTLGRERVLAVTGRSASYPAVQYDVAMDCVRRFQIPHHEVETDELLDPRYTANPANRCYYCKSELWPRLQAVARARGLNAVLDGSNADDAGDYRPGAAAAREHGVRSPLQEAGLTKQEIRTLSQRLQLPTWDQPASPCLSSRLPYGVAVTRSRLQQVEQAEQMLRDAGFREFRVRHHEDCLRLEFAPGELDDAVARASELRPRFVRLGVERVVVDVEGYRRGALNEALVQLQPAAPAGRGPAALPRHDAAGHQRDIGVVRDVELREARALAPLMRDAGFRYIAVDLHDLAGLPVAMSSSGVGRMAECAQGDPPL